MTMTHENKSYQSAIGRAKGLGSAKDGVHHWWMQRVTGVAILLPMIYLICQLPSMMTADYAAFIAWLQMPANAIALLVFVLAGFYHAALGIQVVIEDYVHHEGAKLVSLGLNKIFFFILGLACVYAVIVLTLKING